MPAISDESLIPVDSSTSVFAIKPHDTIIFIMALLELLQHFCVSILIGYLGFTNSLANYLGNFLPQTSYEHYATTETPLPPEEGTLEQLQSSKTSSKDGTVPKILLNNLEFQRASVIASTDDDSLESDTSDIPLTEKIKGALVNVYCQYKTDKYIRTTTGTGVFINQKGVVLTNAHVAQFLLLRDTEQHVVDANCIIRAGDPAEARYTAELLYISPIWIFENADLIDEESPRGTGERDYALLYVSGTLDKTPLPTRFPAIATDTELLSRGVMGSTVVTAGYPAEALFRGGADAKLFPVLATTTITTLYTFGSMYADIFSISESPVGEQGASGGPIVTTNDKDMIGLIVTKGDEQTEGPHSLRAITLSYINRTIIEETGFSLAQNMQGDVALRGSIFKKAMVPFLAELLEDEIKSEVQ